MIVNYQILTQILYINYNEKRLGMRLKLFFPFLFISFSAFSLTTRTWTGATNSDFNTSTNWSPNAVPSSGDSCVIVLTGDKVITLSGSITVGALYFHSNGNNVNGVLDVGSYLLTVEGNFYAFTTGNSNSDTYIDIGASGGGITVGRHTFIGDSGDRVTYVTSDITNPGKFTYKGNLTVGVYGRTIQDYEPDMTFDGTGTQNIVTNNQLTFYLAENLVIGSTNNPTVEITSGYYTNGFGLYNGNFTLNGTSSFDINSFTIDRMAGAGGSFTTSAGSVFKIGGTGDFPASYTTVSLNATSNTYYDGTNQTVTGLTYGHLYLQGSGTKTASATSTVAGNLDISGTPTLDANAILDLNGNVTIGSGTSFLGGTAISHTVAGTWTNNGTFTKETSTVTFDGASNQSIAGSSSSLFYNLTNSNSSTGLTLNANIGASNVLNMNGATADIDLNGYVIDLSSAGSITGETNTDRIYGTTGTITTTRSLSNISSLNVAGMGLEMTTTANLGSTTLTRGHTAQTGVGGTTGIMRYYDISPTTNTGLDATLRFNYFDKELTADQQTNEDSLIYFRSTDGGATWIDRWGTEVAASNYCELAGIDAFSRWTLSNIVTQFLPIELVSFEAKKIANDVVLFWEVSSQYENDFFTVERSLDGKEFDYVGIIDGAGTTDQLINYYLIDKEYRPAINYYRLKQTDYNGKFKYSEIVSIDMSQNAKHIILTVNALGQEVSSHYKGLVFDLFSDGSSEKRFQ
jgi:hypothetical protein